MASIDGLASGLNTSSIISQLMQLERRGQVRLQNQQKVTETAISALQALNSKFLSLSSAAKTFSSGGTSNGWNMMSVTSTDATRATATTTAGAAAGEVTFTIKQLASAETWKTSGTVAALTDVVVAAGTTLTLTKDGVAKSIDTGDGTLGTLMEAIKAAGAGVTATAVQVSPGAYALQLSSTTTGDTAISLTDAAGADPFAGLPLGSLGLVNDGKNALLQVGVAADGSGGYEVIRKTNTVSDLLTGTTITLLKQDSATPVTVRTASDAEAVADGVAKLVDALNATLAEMTRTGSYDSATKRSGPLYGDGAVRSLRSSLMSAATGSSDSSPGLVGVSVQRDGTVKFDRAKFLEALAKDPAGVQSTLGEAGLAGRLVTVADTATRAQGAVGGTGLLTGAISNRQRSITSLKSDIASWDRKLELREQRLTAQFTALEKALGAAQSQGQWLAGQLANLPSYG